MKAIVAFLICFGLNLSLFPEENKETISPQRTGDEKELRELWDRLLETRPEKYASLLAEWQKRKLADHFPKTIDPKSPGLKLSAFPGAWQGGAWVQLRLTLPAAKVEEIFNEATKKAKDFYDGGDMFESVNEFINDGGGGLAGTSFHTSDTRDKIFPKDYRVFIFDASALAYNDHGKWNHGNSRGVVISKKRNEVIYFAEAW